MVTKTKNSAITLVLDEGSVAEGHVVRERCGQE